MITASEIKSRLASQAEIVCRHLVPHGKRIGRQWKCGDVHGAEGDSTIIELDGSRAGIWADFAGDATSERGDLLDLWQAAKQIGFREAFIEAKKWLGVQDPQSHVPKKSYSKPQPKNIIRLRETPDTAVEKYLCNERKLSRETVLTFKIGATKDRKPGKGYEIAFPSYSPTGALAALKYVRIERAPDGKKETDAEPGCAPSMFGWQAFAKDSKTVIITEGEVDSMTWHEWGTQNVLSMPGGASNMNWIDFEWENLEPFETIYLSFDMDDPGQKAAVIAANRLGLYRCKIVKLPFKDANECLQNGVTAEEASRFLIEAKAISPIEIKCALDFRDQVHRLCNPASDDEPEVGLKTSIFGTRLRFRPGEVTLWSGHTSHGKSTLLSQLMVYALLAGQKVSIGSFEVRGPAQLKKMLHCLAFEEQLTREQVDQGIDWLGERLWIYDIIGLVTRPKLFELMNYSVMRHGVQQIVIDSLMKCDLSSEDYEEQRRFVNDLCCFGHEKNVHIHLVGHPRKQKDDDSPPGLMDVNGGQSVVGQPDNMVVIWRNKEKEKSREAGKLNEKQEHSEADTVAFVNKQRLTGEEFRVKLWCKPKCHRFTIHFGQGVPEFENFGVIASAVTPTT